MRNLTLLTDLYEITMMQAYFKNNNKNKMAIFDVFYRKNPMDGGYAISAGLEQVIEYINNLHFTEDDINYLASLKIFEDDFLDYLKNFKFTGDIYAIPEGSVMFPREPMLKVIAPIMEAQFIETAILNILNHQSLIATKAARICYAAEGDGIMEFGLRRAQGPDAGIYGARAAVIGGCAGTSNVLTGQMFDVPVMGTHAHSWIMSFDDEYTAFYTYAKLYPMACTLLVDTYDTLNSGVPNAIKVFKQMKKEGIELKNYGIRLDSGDLAYLSKKARMQVLKMQQLQHLMTLMNFLLPVLKCREQKLQIGVLVLILLHLRIAHLSVAFTNLQLLWKTEKTLHQKLNFQTTAKRLQTLEIRKFTEFMKRKIIKLRLI